MKCKFFIWNLFDFLYVYINNLLYIYNISKVKLEEEIKVLNQKDIDNRNLCDKKNDAIQVISNLYFLGS